MLHSNLFFPPFLESLFTSKILYGSQFEEAMMDKGKTVGEELVQWVEMDKI